MQESVKGSRFYLLYGRDPLLPTTLEVDTLSREEIDVNSYKREMSTKLAEAWELAKSASRRAQNSQKIQYDRQTKPPPIQCGR